MFRFEMCSQVRRESNLSVLVSGDGEQVGTSGWPVVVAVLRRIVSVCGTEGAPGADGVARAGPGDRAHRVEAV